jgi:hypothetical protein
MKNHPNQGKWVSKTFVSIVPLGEFMVLSRKERRCDPWEIKGLRKREKKNQEMLSEMS